MPCAFHLRHASILGLTAVTHERVADQRVEQHIDQCRRKQNSKGPKQLRVIPGDTAADDPHGHDQHAQPLREIFPHEQVRARTYQAPLHSVTLDGILGHGQFLPASVALEVRGIGIKCRFASPHGHAASRSKVDHYDFKPDQI